MELTISICFCCLDSILSDFNLRIQEKKKNQLNVVKMNKHDRWHVHDFATYSIFCFLLFDVFSPFNFLIKAKLNKGFFRRCVMLKFFAVI